MKTENGYLIKDYYILDKNCLCCCSADEKKEFQAFITLLLYSVTVSIVLLQTFKFSLRVSRLLIRS